MPSSNSSSSSLESLNEEEFLNAIPPRSALALATDAATVESTATVAGDVAAPTLSGLVAGRCVSSLCTQRAVDNLCKKHGVPKAYTARPAGHRLACTPPPEGAVCLYAHVLEAGMCVPPPGFFSEVLNLFRLAPSQLSPNGWRILVGFFVLCHDAGVLPSLAVFRYFFYLVKFKLKGWYFFRGRETAKVLFTRLPKCNKGWKDKFFLLTSPDPWRCPVLWGEPPSKSFLNDLVLTSQQEESVAKLQRVTAVDLRTYLCQKNLAAAFSSSLAAESPPPPASVRSTSTGAKGTVKSAKQAAASASRTEKVKAELRSHTSALYGKKRNREEASSDDGDGRSHSELNSLPAGQSCSATAPPGLVSDARDIDSADGAVARKPVNCALELENKLAEQTAARAELEKKDAEVLALWGKLNQGESMLQTVNCALELKKKMAEQDAAKAKLEKKDAEVRALWGQLKQGKSGPEIGRVCSGAAAGSGV